MPEIRNWCAGKLESLLRLEHAVPESISLGQLKVRNQVCRIYIDELGMRWARHDVNIAAVGFFVGAIHFSIVVHGDESGMIVADVVTMSQWNLCQRDGGSGRIDAAGGDICVWKSLEKIVGGPVFLNDDDNVLDFRE